MCTVVRFVAQWSGMLPWDRRKMTINVPVGLPRATTMFILRETLRLIGAPQPPEPTAATCFCGAPVELPTAQTPAPVDQLRLRQSSAIASRPVRHGA